MKDIDHKGLTRNDRETLRVFHSLLEQRRAGTLPAEASLNGSPFRLPRVRLAKDVDLSRAKRGCKRCNGSGVTGHRVLKDGSGEVRIPIVCVCVVKAGGVRADALDRMNGGAG